MYNKEPQQRTPYTGSNTHFFGKNKNPSKERKKSGMDVLITSFSRSCIQDSGKYRVPGRIYTYVYKPFGPRHRLSHSKKGMPGISIDSARFACGGLLSI